MAMVTPSNRGENGHLTRAESTRARGICPTHGVVIPVLVGNRWKCPSCGMFIRKQGGPEVGSVPKVVQRTTDETFWRLEVHRILEAIASKLRELPDHVQALVEYRTAMDWIEWTDAVHMTLPDAELENAVQRIKQVATKLIQAPQLFQDLVGLESDRSVRSQEIDRLHADQAALAEEVHKLGVRAKKLQDIIRSVEVSAQMSSGEILRRIRDLSETRRETEELMDENVHLRQENSWEQRHLAGLQHETQRVGMELSRLRQLEEASWEHLAERLTMQDLMNLIDQREKKEYKELVKRQQAALSSLNSRAG